MATLRTGNEYLRAIKADGRRVFLNAEQVPDVTTHPAFREAARSIAALYDIAADPANRERMTFASPATGEPVLRCYQIPKTPADLVHAAYSAAGLFDLTPLVHTSMAQDLRLDEATAREVSPLFWPAPEGRSFQSLWAQRQKRKGIHHRDTENTEKKK